MSACRAGMVVLAAVTALGCGSPPASMRPKDTIPTLTIESAASLVPAAALMWLVEAAPRALIAHPDLLPAFATVVPPAEADDFARTHGGINPLGLEELAVARYAETTLFVGLGRVAPPQIEEDFLRRAEPTEDQGRAVDAHGAIVRLWGTREGHREQVAIFGRAAVAVEVGHFGPLRAAELFAEGRLHRAVPALRTELLARARKALLGVDGATNTPRTVTTPLLAAAYFVGPFEDDLGPLLGGLVRASTAVALGIRPLPTPPETASPAPMPAPATTAATVEATLTLLGGWGDAAPRAADRLRAAFDTVAASSLGHLSGLDHPRSEPTVRVEPDALTLAITLDALQLARGLRAASGAEASEIFAY